jgi:hypothetical protein
MLSALGTGLDVATAKSGQLTAAGSTAGKPLQISLLGIYYFLLKTAKQARRSMR